jgi:hypothetical protein
MENPCEKYGIYIDEAVGNDFAFTDCQFATKPCDKCGIYIEEAITKGEVTCYKTCELWQEWKKEHPEEEEPYV